MFELRPYQRESVDAIYDYFGSNTGNPLIVLPTGTGKSVCLAAFIKEAISAYPDTRILMLTHVKELIAQNFQALIRMWPEAPAGIYSAGLSRRDINAQVLFAGIQSIHKHALKVQKCDLIIIDEAHLISRNDGSMYRSFINQLNEINAGLLKVVGFTATPYRLDTGLLHVGKDRVFTDIAYQAPILDMIEQGYLCTVIPKKMNTHLDVTGVGKRGGEFIAGQLEAAIDKAEITRAAVDEIIQYGQDRGSWLIFCSGVNHAEHVRDEIRSRGITAEMVVGDTPASERDSILKSFKNGNLRCICNVSVLTTGFDAPGTDLIALLRPTESVGLYIQMIGRGTRLAPGKEDCIVLDFAGNTARHGPIDMVDGGRKRKSEEPGEAPIKTCPECQTINHAAKRFCVSCGFKFPEPEIKLSAKAATNAILSTQLNPEWIDVKSVVYALHSKPGKPTSLRVSYQCGLIWHSEWVCFDHTGYPRTKAEVWWLKRASAPVPRNTAEAANRVKELREPTAIRVKPVGKYVEILGFKFGEGQ